jgi:anti-sigma regulatory factor (Ser/Thr protein kinase)
MRPAISGHADAMARTATPVEVLLALEPRPESARRVRRALEAHGLPEDLEHTVKLLSTEIVGNAIRHAALSPEQRIIFFARVHGDFARIEVADPGPGFDPDTLDTEGYGLRLLDKLAARWGVETDRGCKVWFEVDRRSGRFDRTSGSGSPGSR